MSLLRSTTIITFGNIGSRVFSFASKMLLARLLLASELGGWQLLQTWYFSLSGPFIGVIQTVVTHLTAMRGPQTQQRNLLIAASVYCLIGFALIMLPLLLMPAYFRPEGSAYFFQFWLFLMPTYLVTILNQVLKGWLMGRQRMAPVVLNQWLEQSVELLGMIFLWQSGQKGFAALILVMLIADIIALIHMLICRRIYGGEEAADETGGVWHDLLHHGLPHSVSRGVGSIGRLIEAWLIPLLLLASGMNEDQAIGFYGQLTALALPTLYLPSLLISSLASALLPETAQEKDPKRRRHLVRQSISIALTLGLPIGIFFSVEGLWLGELIFASREVGEMIALLAPMSLLVYVDIVAGQLLRAVGRSAGATLIDILGSAVKLLLLYGSMSTGGGLMAIAEATIISSFIGAVLNLLMLLWEVEIGYALLEWLWQPMLVALPFTAILLVPVVDATPLLRLIQVILAFLMLAVAVLWRYRRSSV